MDRISVLDHKHLPSAPPAPLDRTPPPPLSPAQTEWRADKWVRLLPLDGHHPSFATTLPGCAPSSSAVAEKLQSRVIRHRPVRGRCRASVTFWLDHPGVELWTLTWEATSSGSASIFRYARHPAGKRAYVRPEREEETRRRRQQQSAVVAVCIVKGKDALLKMFLYGFRRKWEIF